jgi:glutamate-1-semialdehyde 2,1-aminomutase
MKNNKPNITRSNEIYERAIKTIPSGTQTLSKGVTQFVNGFAPKYIARAKGAYTWDVDGNKYLDFIMGCHPIILGYADPDINAAVIEQLEKGSTYSLMSELEVSVTELIIKAIPCAEMVRFGKNGADATTIGVRVARAVTGRDHIAYCGYHGWHDWFIGDTDLNRGIPDFNKKLSHSFNYNDLDSLEKIFLDYPDEIAIVIMEPLSVIEPKCFGESNCSKSECKDMCQNHFLHEVQKMAKFHGALLMFDEIITGFRFSFGGAQELVGVTPDLASFAKGISNGIPLSALAGKKEYMQVLDKTFFSFTYGGDCIGLAAAEACIPKLEYEKVSDHLWHIGSILKEGFNELAINNNLDEFISCIGYPCRTIISFDGQGKYDELEIKSFFQQELIRRGVLWTAYHAISWSHNKEDIEFTLKAFDESMQIFKKILSGNKPLRSFIEGDPVKPVFRKVADFNSYTTKK